jgi:hypothetical protein
MNKDWSNTLKDIKTKLLKKDTFKEGIVLLINLRNELFNQLLEVKNILSLDDFYKMPYANHQGYQSKTIAYSIWHIFRIEDIVVHTLMKNDKQILLCDNYLTRINSNIITTGNELLRDEIVSFSKRLNIEELYKYAIEIKKQTDEYLLSLNYDSLKTTISEETRISLINIKAVSEDSNALWLVDYWCKKNYLGLIMMPLSRHWIMHIEAVLRIKNKIHSR